MAIADAEIRLSEASSSASNYNNIITLISNFSYVFSYTNESEENYKGDCKLDEQISDLINFLNTNLTDNDAYQSLREVTLKNK